MWASKKVSYGNTLKIGRNLSKIDTAVFFEIQSFFNLTNRFMLTTLLEAYITGSRALTVALAVTLILTRQLNSEKTVPIPL